MKIYYMKIVEYFGVLPISTCYLLFSKKFIELDVLAKS